MFIRHFPIRSASQSLRTFWGHFGLLQKLQCFSTSQHPLGLNQGKGQPSTVLTCDMFSQKPSSQSHVCLRERIHRPSLLSTMAIIMKLLQRVGVRASNCALSWSCFVHSLWPVNVVNANCTKGDSRNEYSTCSESMCFWILRAACLTAKTLWPSDKILKILSLHSKGTMCLGTSHRRGTNSATVVEMSSQCLTL